MGNLDGAKVFGVGINDAGYETRGSGGVWICPYFLRWVSMLKRCYDTQYRENSPSYNGCSVCDEWLTFSVFKSWMENQDWKSNHLDKDILSKGNKIYCPEHCCFVTATTNYFLVNCYKPEGDLPLGVNLVTKVKGAKKYQANCRDPFSKKKVFLGLYAIPRDAHIAWKSYKHKLAVRFAGLQTDKRESDALLVMYK